MSTLVDSYGRRPRKLRVSLTDRCNFRCGYCMPDKPAWAAPNHLLAQSEFLRLIRLLVNRGGVQAVRMTGGEPLLSRDLEPLLEALRSAPDTAHVRLSLTTNAELLARRIGGLKSAGLDDVNVSLDSLDSARFDQLTRTRGRLPQVLAGIDAAVAAAVPVKINSVLIRGRNEQDVVPLLRWAGARGLIVRFIEFMPLEGGGLWQPDSVFSEADVLAQVRGEIGEPQLLGAAGPASQYRLPDGQIFGVIPTITRPFCSQCDRLRLTATGALYTCLFAQHGTDLRAPLRSGANDESLLGSIQLAVAAKQAGYAGQGAVERPITMHGLGG